MLAKSVAGGTTEVTILDESADETGGEAGTTRGVWLRGINLASEEVGKEVVAELFDGSTSGTVLAKLVLEKEEGATPTTAPGNLTFWVPAYGGAGDDKGYIEVPSGKIVLKRTGKGQVTVYYDQSH